MRKKSPFINNEKGLILPLVLLISALMFLFVSTNVSIYHNELIITKNELSQLKINTLFQMGRSKFKSESSSLTNSSGTTDYIFPDGNVEINYTREENVFVLVFSISTPDNKSFIIKNQMIVEKELNNQTDSGQTS